MRSGVTIFLAALFMCLCAHPGKFAAQTVSAPAFRFKHYSEKDGLLNNFADRLKQDSLGFIWIQYYGGLTRFDGYTFKTYPYDAEDPQTAALPMPLGFILKDPTNEISIPERRPSERGAKRRLVRYHRKTDSFVKYEIDLPDIPILQWLYEKNGDRIWIGTAEKGLFAYDFKNDQVTHYQDKSYDSKNRGPNSITLIRHYRQHLLVGSQSRGLWIFDRRTGLFSRPACNPLDTAIVYHANIVGIIDNPDRRDSPLWIITDKDFLKLDSTFSVRQRLGFPKGILPRSAACDRQGVFWFPSAWGSNEGLYRYDSRDSSLVQIKNDPNDPRSLASDMVYDVIVDAEDNVWVGTDRGVSVLRKSNLTVYNYKVERASVWAATVYQTKNSEYLIYSKSPSPTRKIEIARIDPVHPGVLDFKPFLQPVDRPVIKMVAGKRQFWVALSGGGIIGYAIDSVTGTIREDQRIIMKHDAQNPNTLTSNVITDLWEDGSENLWVQNMVLGIDRIRRDIPYGTTGSVLRYGKKLNGFAPYAEDDRSFWITTHKGASLFEIPAGPTDSGRVITNIRSVQIPTKITKTNDGSTLLATHSGVYEIVKQAKSYRLNRIPLIMKEKIVSINEDRFSRLWMHADRRIICLDRKDSILSIFDNDDGIDHLNGIEETDWLKQTANGTLIVAGRTGFSFIDPASFKISDRKTFPVLTRLEINNVEVSGINLPGDSSFSPVTDITLLKHLSLDHHHNNFTVEFSAMEMSAPEKNRYRHKLEGFDRDWIETDARHRTASYTNLEPGHYIFRVSSSNHHGIWSGEERTLAIRVLHPPWKTWWAYMLYAIAFTGVVLYWRTYENKRLKLQHRAEHLSELDSLKTRFFTNISHEFRTPLTLMLGPLREMNSTASNPQQKSILEVMIRNGQRLMSLINQLLDLSKLEAGKMQLHFSAVDLVAFMREIVACYESMAAEKNIRYFFHPEVRELMMYIDEEKLEKVMHNLLSNAFKFTREKGEVIVNMKAVDNMCIISVSDTGIGIPQDQLDKVFDRFYQVDNSQTRGYEGSGLGLALSKDLIALHGGKITVESREGKGTEFSVTFPIITELGSEHSQAEKQTRERYSPQGMTPSVVEGNHVEVSGNGSDVQPLVLVVEDNPDMRQYVCRVLSQHYQIIESKNGRDGVTKATAAIPDLIICDIMMPGMDGYKLCEHIKTHELTSHIPVVLLTAKADRDSKLSGLETGADDYLLKPFDADELKLIVRNLIEARRIMRERFSKEITLEPNKVAVTSLDERFLKKVMAIVEQHMDDDDFSIEEFAASAGYSSIHFYRKIKALTGQTPSVFLRTIRLKRAADLLSKNSDNISQIAYSVGFNSVSYFNKCFKEQFGVTPGQFGERGLHSKN